MASSFANSTAEIVVQVAEAVSAFNKAKVDEVCIFCDLPKNYVEDALTLAVDLGLIVENTQIYSSASPLTRFLSTPDLTRKAALLRVFLESYRPFVEFRQRLRATGNADTAAQQTRSLLNIQCTRNEIKDTLISLGTFARALVSHGGGKYTATDDFLDQQIYSLSETANDESSAEFLIRRHIGKYADQLNRQDVILPLAHALLKQKASDPRGTIVDAARAVESFIAFIASKKGVSLAGTTGIIQKLDKLKSANVLPKKIVEAAKYLGQIRNAADHGVDVEVNAAWAIQSTTGLHYTSVACSFMSASFDYIENNLHTI